MDLLTTFAIVCPLVGIAGFVDAIAGGGSLISLPAYLMAGVAPHTALATNKLSNCMGTGLAAYRLARKGFMKPRVVALPVVAGLIGSTSGTLINLLLSDEVLTTLMLIVLPLTALYLMRPRALREHPDRLSLKRTVALAAAVSLGVGLYDGFYGPGTGTFLMILYTSVAHLTLNDAAGTTKAVNLVTNISSLAVFLANGQVFVLLGLVAGICNMVGAYIGVNLFTEKGAAVVKPIMFVVIGIFFVKTLLEVLGVA